MAAVAAHQEKVSVLIMELVEVQAVVLLRPVAAVVRVVQAQADKEIMVDLAFNQMTLLVAVVQVVLVAIIILVLAV
jgi:hypothetical protein